MGLCVSKSRVLRATMCSNFDTSTRLQKSSSSSCFGCDTTFHTNKMQKENSLLNPVDPFHK